MPKRSVTLSIRGKNEASKPLDQVKRSHDRLSISVRRNEAELSRLAVKQGKLKTFKKLSKELDATNDRLKEAQKRTAHLAKEIKNADKPTAAMVKRFEAAKRETQSLSRVQKRQTNELREYQRELGSSARSMRHVELAERRLRAETERLTTSTNEQRRAVDRRDMQREKNSRRLSKVGKKVASAGKTGVAAVVAGSIAGSFSVANFDAKLEQLAVDSGSTREEMAKIKERIIDVSARPDVKVTREQLVEALAVISADTGNIGLGVNLMDVIGQSISATGAEGSAIGSLVTGLNLQLGIKDPQIIKEMIEFTAQAGKVGSYEVKNLAEHSKRLIAAQASTGRVGEEGAREMISTMQVINSAVGTAEQSVTVFERMIDAFTSEKVGVLRAGGIEVWDAENLKKGVELLRPMPDLIDELLKKTKGVQKLLAESLDGTRNVESMHLTFNGKTKKQVSSLLMYVKSEACKLLVISLLKTALGMHLLLWV